MPRAVTNTANNDKDLASVSESIVAILSKTHSKLSLSPLHAAVNRLVNNSCIPKLTEILKNHLTNHFMSWCKDIKDCGEGQPLVTKFSNFCSDFNSFCDVLPKLYSQYDAKLNKDDDIMTLAILNQKFKEIILDGNDNVGAEGKSLINSVIDSIIKQIDSERSKDYNTDHYTKTQIKIIITLFYDFKDKKQEIIKVFLNKLEKSTESFYEKTFNYLKQENFNDFLRDMKNKLTDEENLLKVILKDENDAIKILKIAHENALFKNEYTFCKANDDDYPKIYSAVTEENCLNLKWLIRDSYIRFNRREYVISDIIPVICTSVEKEISKFELDKIKPQETIDKIIKAVLSRTKPYEEVFCKVERSKKKVDDAEINLEKQARKAFEDSVQKGWSKPNFNTVESFNKYIDFHIKLEFKHLTQEQKANFPSTIATFFRYTPDKVAFIKIYEQNFLSRLIKLGEKLKEIEFPTIEAIRKERSPDFIGDFQNLIEDVNKSKEIETDFKRSISNKSIDWGKHREIDFTPLIIQRSSFKLHIAEQKKVPDFLEPIHNEFVSFYTNKFRNRILTLLGDFSLVHSKWLVPANAKCKSQIIYNITTCIVGAKILHAVDRLKNPSTAELIEQLQEDKKLILNGLVRLSNLKIINRTSQGKEYITDTDTFAMNANFYNQSKVLLVAPLISTKKENKQIGNEQITTKKNNLIKASIVRVLKAKQRVSQEEVESVAIQDMRQYFTPDLELIRANLQQLEGNYFSREGSGDGQMLVYNK